MPRRTREELDSLAVIDPEIDAILKSGLMPSMDIDYSDTVKAVQQMRAMFKTWVPPLTEVEGIKLARVSYTARDGVENRMMIFRPSTISATTKLPVIVHLHGGGGAMGNPESTATFCQTLAQKQQCVVFAPAYRLAPEHTHPTGWNDCFDAVQYIGGNADRYGADSTLGFILGGHSFGGSTSARVALEAVQCDMKASITGLYFGTGAFLGREIPEGYEDQYQSGVDPRCLNAPILSAASKKVFDDAGASIRGPVWRSNGGSIDTESVKRLPPCYFSVCGMDLSRDDSLIFEDILRTNGVETLLDIYPGAPHIFWDVFRNIGQARKWAEDTQIGFAWLLKRKDS